MTCNHCKQHELIEGLCPWCVADAALEKSREFELRMLQLHAALANIMASMKWGSRYPGFVLVAKDAIEEAKKVLADVAKEAGL